MKTAMLTAVALCVMTNLAIAQEPEPLSRSIFKLSPQHFIHNSLKAGVERFNPTHSGSFVFFITGMMENRSRSYYAEGYDGVAGELQLRKYVSPMKAHTSKHNKVYHQGIYGAAYMQGGYYTGKFKGETGTYDRVSGVYTPVQFDYHEQIMNGGFGFTMGYQKTLWQVIFLEAFVGGGIQLAGRDLTGLVGEAYDDYDEGIINPYYRGILPKIGLNIGIGL